MSVLLISPQRTANIVGLKALHIHLLTNGIDSTLLCLPDHAAEEPEGQEQVKRFVAQHSPDLIGISVMAAEHAVSSALTTMLKQAFPDIPIVWGGIHPTSVPEMCLKHVDYVCVGEGEGTLLEMAKRAAQGQSFRDVPNLCYMENGEIRRNPLFPLIEDLDSLPALTWIAPHSYIASRGRIGPLGQTELQRHLRQKNIYFTIASRGCPNACSYCCNSNLRRIYGHWGVRRRGTEHLIDELERAVRERKAVEYVNFYDDCFLACSMKTLEEFCREYKKRIGKPIIARSAPAFISEERMRLLKDAGLVWLNVGLQSGSARVCREVYHRVTTPDEFLRAAHILHSQQIAPFYDVIMDNPFESEEEMLQTVEVFMATPKPFYPSFLSLTFYHGTELRDRALREYPDSVEDPTVKDFFVHHPKPINDLMEISATFPTGWTRYLLGMYRKAPDSPTTRFWLRAATLLNRALVTPLTYLRVIHLAERKSFPKTLRVLPHYLRVGLDNYFSMLFGKANWRRALAKWFRKGGQS